MAVDDGGDRTSQSGDGERLARVTYLPGVVPPPSAPPSSSDDDWATDDGWATTESAPLPDFASFFGEAEEPRPAAVTGAPVTADADVDAAQDAPTKRRSTRADSAEAPVREDALGRNKREVRAENVSMHALARRGMSRWELEKTLLSRDFEPEAVDEELDRLERVGLLDDAALAETLVRTQHERKGLGRSALTAELRRRHIDQEHIDAAMEQVDDDGEQSRATELALKRASQLASYDMETAKRRLTGFLMRKGYGSSVVRNAVDEALSGRSSGSSSGVRFR